MDRSTWYPVTDNMVIVDEPQLFLRRLRRIIGGLLLLVQGYPGLDRLPQGHGVALRVLLGHPHQQASGQRALLSVVGNIALTGKTGILRQLREYGGAGCLLPAQDGQPLIHAAHLPPILLAERSKERGLHLGECHGVCTVIERACRDAAGQIVTIREGVVAAGDAGVAVVVAADDAARVAAARRDDVSQPRQLLAALDLIGRGLRARAVGQRKDPAALRVRTGLALYGHDRVRYSLTFCVSDRKRHRVGRHLSAQDGIAVVNARRRSDKRVAQRGGEHLERIRGLGRGICIRRQPAEVIAVLYF